MIKSVALSLFLSALAFAEIRFDPVVLDAIRYNECYIIKSECHPFTIRLNTKQGQNKAHALGYDVNNGLISFQDAPSAVNAAQQIIGSGVANMDLGAYQINYYYHPADDLDIYFDEKRARRFASRILAGLTKAHGYSWRTLGRYHSATADLNRAYYLKLHQYIYGYKP